MKQGLIHIYTGDGKGKTSAAVGACVRAAGHGWRILFVQFLKGSFTGELIPLEKLGVSVCRTEDVKKSLPDAGKTIAGVFRRRRMRSGLENTIWWFWMKSSALWGLV